jgi:hypothetical protein
MAARKRPRICLPRRPTDFVSRLDPKATNVLMLGETAYRLNGFVELTLGGAPKRLKGSLWNANIVGERVGKASKGSPKRVHLRLVAGRTAALALNPETGRGETRLALELTYDELSRSRETIQDSHRDAPARPAPARAEVSASISYDLRRGGFSVSASGMAASLPPFTANAMPVALVLACLCDTKIPCLDVCVSVKVRFAGGSLALTTSQLGKIFAKLNKTWACEPPGQCCIKFTVSEHRIAPGLPAGLAIGPSVDAAWRAVSGTMRSARCFNLYFIERMTGRTATGATVESGADSAAIVGTAGRTTDSIAETVNHEMGHALGLSLGAADDAEGVTGHSTRPENVMAGPSATARTKLNEKQCKRSRSSTWARWSDRKCVMAPLE